jgi:hypothetical protein
MKSLKSLCALAFVGVLALTPTPALATEGIAGGAGDGLSVLETVGIFVLLPASLYGLIWLLWSIPKWRREASAPATGEKWNPRPTS